MFKDLLMGVVRSVPIRPPPYLRVGVSRPKRSLGKRFKSRRWRRDVCRRLHLMRARLLCLLGLLQLWLITFTAAHVCWCQRRRRWAFTIWRLYLFRGRCWNDQRRSLFRPKQSRDFSKCRFLFHWKRFYVDFGINTVGVSEETSEETNNSRIRNIKWF